MAISGLPQSPLFDLGRTVATAKATTRPGERVIIGNVPHSKWDDRDPGYVYPRTADAPDAGVYVTKRSTGDEFKITYRRTDQVYKSDVPVPDKPGYVYTDEVLTESTGWASVTFTEQEQWWLPLDHIDMTIARLEWYPTSRDDRQHYQHLVPLLRATLRVLRDEALAEEPFRDLCKRTLGEEHPAWDRATIRRGVDHTVRWWKTKNATHRALMSDGSETTAFDEVLTQCERLLKTQDLPVDTKIVANLKSQAAQPLWLGRKPDGSYVAIQGADEHYVHVHEASAKRGVRRPVREWVPAPDVRLWKQIERTQDWLDYGPLPSPAPLTGPERESLIDDALHQFPNAIRIGAPSPTRVSVTCLGEGPVIDVDHRLTGTNNPPTRERHYRRIERTASQTTLAASPGRGPHVESALHVERSDSNDWVNPDQSTLHGWVQQWEAHRDIVVGLEAKVREIVEAIEARWVEVNTDREYRSFLDKYGREAAGKWDGHHKLIQQKRLTYPWDRHDTARTLTRAAQVVVESGHQLHDPADLDELRAAHAIHEHEGDAKATAILATLTYDG